MGYIASLTGALLGTWALTAFFRWALRRFIAAEIPRLLVANVASLAFATVVAGYNWAADSGPPVFMLAFLTYALPQVIVLVCMLATNRAQKTT